MFGRLPLQAEAADVLASLDLAAVVADIGPMLLTGSYVSGLMCWPDLDVMVHVGAGFSPRDVLALLQDVVDLPGVVGFDYRDERGQRSLTGTTRDERYHVRGWQASRSNSRISWRIKSSEPARSSGRARRGCVGSCRCRGWPGRSR